LGDGFALQVAPGVVTVAVAPVLGLAVDGGEGAVGARVLRGDKPVQRIVVEGLATSAVTVVGYPPDVAVVAAVQMEVVADGKDLVGGRQRGFHGDRLQALVVAEPVSDAVGLLTHPLLRSPKKQKRTSPQRMGHPQYGQERIRMKGGPPARSHSSFTEKHVIHDPGNRRKSQCSSQANLDRSPAGYILVRSK